MLRLSRIIASGYIAICLVALALTALIGPLGYAPFPLVRAPARPPITVTIWYSTEKREWLEAAKQQFEATNPTSNGRPIQVAAQGPRLARDRPARGQPGLARRNAADRDQPGQRHVAEHVQRAGCAQPAPRRQQPLVISPLVVVGWEERAKVLWPNGPQEFLE